MELTTTISLMQIVIPGLTRNPVFAWIPAFAVMTRYVVLYSAVLNTETGGKANAYSICY